MLPKFKQYVDLKPEERTMLDLVYTNSLDAYEAMPHPHLSHSDHISVVLLPAFNPLLKHSRPVTKQTRVCPEGATAAFQDCFIHTYWEVFKTAASQGDQTDVEEYAEAVTSYIAKCTEDATVVKALTAHSNQKPWMTAEVCSLLTACSARSALPKRISALTDIFNISLSQSTVPKCFKTSII